MPVVRSVSWITGAQINGREGTVLRRRSAVDKNTELPALHSITSSARSARASIVAGMVSAWGRQRPRGCEPWKHSTPADGVPKEDHLLDEEIAVSMARARRPAEAILARSQVGCEHTSMATYNAC